MKKKINHSARQTITMKIAVGTIDMMQKIERTAQNICETEGLKSQHCELKPIRCFKVSTWRLLFSEMNNKILCFMMQNLILWFI